MKPIKQKNKYASAFNFLSKSKLKKESNEDWKLKYLQECYYTQLLLSYQSVNQALTDYEPVDSNEWLASNSNKNKMSKIKKLYHYTNKWSKL